MINIKIFILIWLLVGLAASLIVVATSESPKYKQGDYKYILLGTIGGILTPFIVGIIFLDIYILSPIKQSKRDDKDTIK